MMIPEAVFREVTWSS